MFQVVGIDFGEDVVKSYNQHTATNNFTAEGLTIDKIIEKFIPIAGALFLIVGFGYLLYANAWIHLEMEIRIALGFFFSLTIIGGSFSFSENMRYFTDIGIGAGVLLLYGTLIYGSRTTEMVTVVIPEIVTLLTAVLFTFAVSYFASKRNSKVILILGMIGAYITPFVIGQNDVWVENISFNAYLIYFLAVNVAVFLMGRELSVRQIIPLNVIGLFVGVSTLWSLSLTDGINAIKSGNFFTGEIFTSILFLLVAVFSMWSILLSAKRFLESGDGYLSLGYIALLVWFIFNIGSLESLSHISTGVLYTVMAIACFVGWHVLLSDDATKIQHGALYASGLIATILAFFSFFQEINVFISILISYLSLIFAFLYLLDVEKTERFVSYMIVSGIGSVLSLTHILDTQPAFETLLIVVALVPAMSAYFIAKTAEREEFLPIAKTYSIFSSIVALLYVLKEFLEYIDSAFLLFYLVPLFFLIYIALNDKGLSHDTKSGLMRAVLFWFAFGFMPIFFTLVDSIYPAPTNTYIFTKTSTPIDWVLIKGVFATAILFIGLLISRRLQQEQVVRRPSFILVIFGFATLLLTGSYIIYAIMNDLQIPMGQGGPRALATTIWWVVIAIYMLLVGIKQGKMYYAEKLLGLILLAITTGKVILYDMSTMGMENKIVILMMVGGAMLLFSYFIKSKNLLNRSSE